MKKVISSILLSALVIMNISPCVLAEKVNPPFKLEGGNHQDNRYYFDPIEYTVNTGKDNGFSGNGAINSNDPHSGWQLGKFFIEGYTDIIVDDGEIIVLKNVGDQIRFGYLLEEDIDCLNDDETLSINDDVDNTDTAFQIPRQDFGRGALFVRHTDYQGNANYPAEYTDFLEGCSVGADTDIDMYEEGDYSVALDYEIKDGRNVFGNTSFFGHSILPSYTDYRYSFSFKIRNSNCMVYPMDSNDSSELHDGDLTPNGFSLDLARSRYLTINVKYSQISNGRPVIISNRTASDGDVYESEGIYEIEVSNESTNRSTTIVIFVGSSPELNVYVRQYNGVPEPEDTDVSDADITDAADTSEDTSSDVEQTNTSIEDTTEWLDSLEMSSPDLRKYINDSVYDELIDSLGEDYYIENISTSYVSQEYLDEVAYNSLPNVFFGYTLEELDEAFEGQPYIFTVNENNETEVQLLETYGNVDIYDQMLENVTVGTGVIIVCVTVSLVAAPAAPAVSIVFAAAAVTGAEMAISSAVISGVSTLIIDGYQTGNMDLALDSALVSASEGFKWGAIIGAITGGAYEAITLRGVTINPNSTLNPYQFVQIQREMRWNPAIIGRINSWEEYMIYKNAGLVSYKTTEGIYFLAPEIDWTYVDPQGLTNAERVMRGWAPLDPSGSAMQVHHIGQAYDSPFAILTNTQHRLGGNFSILHPSGVTSTAAHDSVFNAAKRAIYEYLLSQQNPALYASLV